MRALVVAVLVALGVLLGMCGCSTAALPVLDSQPSDMGSDGGIAAVICEAPPCAHIDPNGHSSAAEIGPCDLGILLSNGAHVICYNAGTPNGDTGLCSPDPQTVYDYDPRPPLGFVAAATCEECARIARACK